MSRIALLSATCLFLGACQSPIGVDQPASAAPPSLLQTEHGFGPEVSTEDLSMHIKVLASDEFGGRAPGTPGEDKTVAYLTQQFQRLGLKPGNGDSYVQTVPMIESLVSADSTMSITTKGQSRSLLMGKDMVMGTRSEKPEVKIDASDMVFVGYGVNASEQNWNDYAGLNVKGKTVVMLINDPGFHVGDVKLFEGRRMTYYGRWTYKFEEAARQGASAALIIHDTEGAAYGWDVVKNSWSGAQFDLPISEDPEPRVPVQGWLTADAANQLFQSAGLDFMKLRAAASQRGFKPVSLHSQLSVDLKSSTKHGESRNVLAILPGKTHPDEAIVYTAHWDHLGTHPGEPGDNIYNGAIDNASGVAGVLEIAEQFTVNKPADRSVVFLFVTLEESGLLGSKYYAAHPIIPLAKTVAVINLDAMTMVGPAKDLTVIGLGNSELDDWLAPIAASQKRVLRQESSPEKGTFFRSDHFSFAKAGVPAVYAKGGIDNLEKGPEYGQSVLDEYTGEHYHKAADNFDPNWDLRGVVQDLNALQQLGKTLANSDKWPNYYEGNAFRKARDASRASATK
ncbi:MAG TPA: M28 family metallopeptidase [Arenimonas sp.]|nr:M28 family metallopeptidase [Arenimonas sp.]HOZ04776.1 M28 family metallopeptidase [Arenimonas sp.]HPO24203.1 M28 family metallopeptidase [Arenimonas sp.]HPW32024.1 M28 family metallopeptidase [Arenimonas sp.]